MRAVSGRGDAARGTRQGGLPWDIPCTLHRHELQRAELQRALSTVHSASAHLRAGVSGTGRARQRRGGASAGAGRGERGECPGLARGLARVLSALRLRLGCSAPWEVVRVVTGWVCCGSGMTMFTLLGATALVVVAGAPWMLPSAAGER